jgi:nitroreductase
MISELRKKIHIIEKEKLENVFNQKKINDAKNLYLKLKNNLSKNELQWIEEVLFDNNFKCETLDLDDFSKVIYGRRSIRKWTNKDISIKDIEKIIQSALYAPSSCNRQPLDFIIVTDKLKIELLSKCKKQVFIKNSNCCFLILVDMNVYKKEDFYFAYLDAGAAIQNMLLTIHYMSIGACWINTHPKETNINEIKNIFNIPDNYMLASMIALGYPAHNPKTPGRKEVSLKINEFK